MAREGGSGSKPVADTKGATKEAAAKYAGTGSTSSSSTKSTASKTSSSSKSSVSPTAKRAISQSLTSGGGGSSGSSGSPRTSTISADQDRNLTPELLNRLSESGRRTAAASSADAKARTEGKNLRGNTTPSAKQSLLVAAAAKSAQQELAKDRANSDDQVDPNDPFMEFLQAPYQSRVERAGGKPFEGPVDWEGIGAAIFGGPSVDERDDALRRQRTPLVPADPSRFDPFDPNGGPTWEQFDDYVNNTDSFGKRAVDPESGFVLDPKTGTYYRKDLLPDGDTRIAAQPPGIQLQPLDGLKAGLLAEQERLFGGGLADVKLPRRDPRGVMDPRGGIDQQVAVVVPDADPVIDPVIDPVADPIDVKLPGGKKDPEPKKKTAWDDVVEMGGGLLEHTGLGGIVKGLFPDIWYGAGESMKGIDDGLTYGGSSGTNFEYLPQNGSLSEQSPGAYYDFIDNNHNGIDDRLEGGGGTPPPYVQGPPSGARVASFPTMPPYNPGRDNEWAYFTNNRLAQGGIVQAYAEGGQVATDDPRMEVIAAAEDALEKIAAGQKPDEQDAAALKKFVAQFGDGALRSLNDNVTAGMKMNGGSGGRMVKGPGGPTDDAIPAVIDGHAPAALSSNEFVFPVAAVAGAGGGDIERGAEALQQLSERLAAGMKA